MSARARPPRSGRTCWRGCARRAPTTCSACRATTTSACSTSSRTAAWRGSTPRTNSARATRPTVTPGCAASGGPAAPDSITSSAGARPGAARELGGAWRHEPLTHATLWPIVAGRLRPGDVILADQGTAAFGANALPLPTDARVITQPLWASIGYSLPAALGTALAAPERRHILLIGDGACQLTAAEIGTIGRAGAHPLVLVLDNGGYAIEDAIHPTTADYNSIAPWDHALLPTAFQVADHWTTATVRTPAELHLALDTAEHTRGRATLVRLVLPRDDYPAGLAEIAARKRA